MTPFARVRNAFVADIRSSLDRIGVEVRKLGGDWASIKCPFCDDTSGSASVSIHSGHLKCHQCQKGGERGVELFTWFAEWKRVSAPKPAWEACKQLAGELGVTITPPAIRRKLANVVLSDEVVERAMHDLWESPAAEPYRQFLAQRKFVDPIALEPFQIGYLGDRLIFPQRNEAGILQPRFRAYDPGAAVKWTWSRGSGSPMGLWPAWRIPPAGATVWLLEGEWDVLTGWIVLEMALQGHYAYTWTGGANSPLIRAALPDWLRQRHVEVLYDNDTFQGPILAEHVAPPSEQNRRHKELALRRKNLIENVAGVLEDSLQCEVFLRAVPINPIEKWGADLRDWADRGGRNLDELPRWPLELVRGNRANAVTVSMHDVYRNAGRVVVFQAQVGAIDRDGLTVPKLTRIQCAMGAESYCKTCHVPRRFPEGAIHWDDWSDALAHVLAAPSHRREEEIRRRVLGRPTNCNFCELHHEEYEPACRWTGLDPASDASSERELVVISSEAPALSGEVDVTGRALHATDTVVVLADTCQAVDNPPIDLRPMLITLRQLTPWKANDVDTIDEYLQRRVADLSANVTRIYGRHHAHVAVELVAHSALWLNVDHAKRRGWIDASMLGDTRTGKSLVARNLIDFYGLGRVISCQNNVSRAGLTLGAVMVDKNSRVRPGLFPRHHRKMLVLDEFHTMFDEVGGSPMMHLQEARDTGVVGGVKVYGSRQLPAAVRLLTIANWFGSEHRFRFACEHLLALYGRPESLSRLDFGFLVRGEPTETGIVPAPHVFKRELVRALALRAWQLTPDRIKFEPDGIELAQSYVQQWRGEYSDELPLFTAGEKLYSVLRIATAVANLCFSHPEEDPYVTVVRRAHVEWAAQWLLLCWDISRYKAFSMSAASRREISRPFHAEAMFTAKIGLPEAEAAVSVLSHFYGGVTRFAITSLLNKDYRATDQWINAMIGYGALEQRRAQGGSNEIALTAGGHRLLGQIIRLCELDPEQYADRYAKLYNWMMTYGGDKIPSETPSGLLPLDNVDELIEHHRRETDLLGSPEAG